MSRHSFLTLSTLIAVAVQSPAHAVPCIDTNSQSSFFSRTMVIKIAGRPEVAITGSITSLDTRTGQLTLEVWGSGQQQQIKPVSIEIHTGRPSMVAQMPLPQTTPIGHLSRDVRLSDITIEKGVIRDPQCQLAAQEHEVAFDGRLTFQGNKLTIDGEFVDYTIPRTDVGPGGASGRKGG